jgi:hypothetical protein
MVEVSARLSVAVMVAQLETQLLKLALPILLFLELLSDQVNTTLDANALVLRVSQRLCADGATIRSNHANVGECAYVAKPSTTVQLCAHAARERLRSREGVLHTSDVYTKSVTPRSRHICSC